MRIVPSSVTGLLLMVMKEDETHMRAKVLGPNHLSCRKQESFYGTCEGNAHLYRSRDAASSAVGGRLPLPHKA